MNLPRAHLERLLRRQEEIAERLGKPEALADKEAYRALTKEFSELEEITGLYREYLRIEREMAENESLLSQGTDPEFASLVKEELEGARRRLAELERRIGALMLPDAQEGSRDIIMEIRAGVGGEEAALFAADLFRMYSRYAERQGWKVEVIDGRPTDTGGFAEIILSISGDRVFRHLKYESGTHRVQRVPVTESQGRIHTSAATVAVLPEAEEVEVEISPNDLEIETFRASGPGGQHVNKTSSAVRIRHLPTGLVVSCQDEKSQHKNKAKAMRVLRARLYQRKREELESQRAMARRMQIGSGDRSERIRTYNFPQNRVTDHRINLTLYRLDAILDGDLDELIKALAAAELERTLGASGGEGVA